jgi:hypothetical protein
MGAWDAGPFDNDDAADFAQELDDADPNERIVLLRDALRAAIDSEDEEDLDTAEPRAVAAAAVLVADRIDPGAVADSAYAPKFLGTGEALDVPDDLIELAVLALDRVAESDSEWSELFREAETLDVLRDALVGNA